MPILYAFAALLLILTGGNLLAQWLGLPLPGSLIGLLLLLAALIAYGRVPSGMRDTSHHLLKHLMLLFIPAVAGVMTHFDYLAREWLPFLAACVAGAAVTIIVTALTFSWMLNRRRAAKP